MPKKPRDSSAPIKGDARRQASAAIRGFVYQFWRTVQAWLDLEPEENLYVEAAEDFDIVASNSAVAAQIKDNRASGSLTLGSSDAITALNNYWNLKIRNVGRGLQFKFVTTASIGTEQNGFSTAQGIEVWNLCRLSPASGCLKEIESIRAFLAGRQITTELKAFLESASSDQVHTELISPLEWVANEPDLADVQQIVIGRIIRLGSSRGITARDATQLAESLCAQIIKAAVSRPSEPLTLVDLTAHLDRAAYVEVPRATLQNKSNYENSLRQMMRATTQAELPTVVDAADAFSPPLVPANTYPRAGLIESLKTALSRGIIYVDGSAGTGKTTAVRQALEAESSIRWLNLRDYTLRNIIDACRDISRHIRSNRESATVVLDDLNPLGDSRVLEESLGRLCNDIRQYGGKLVVISYHQAGPRLASVLGISDQARIHVPSFADNEVCEFLIDQGCNDENAKKLGRLIWAQTGGHPQLVAARVAALKAASFASPTIDEIFQQPQDLSDARAEAQNVVRSVLSESARTLLYRLSLVLPPLRHPHALRIAAIRPSIHRPGETLADLVGPWVERLDQGHYRVSALVSRSAEQNLSPQEIKKLHGDIATVYLAEDTISIHEFSGAFVHAMAGEAAAQIALLCQAFMTAPDEIKRELASRLSWVARIGIDSNTHLPALNAAIRQLLWLMQWDIAGLTSPELLGPISERMEGAFQAKSKSPLELGSRFIFLTKQLLQVDFQISPDRFVPQMLEIFQIAEFLNAQEPELKIGEGVPPMYPAISRSVFYDFFSAALLPRIRSIESLQILISTLDHLQNDERAKLLDGFKTDDGELRMLFNGPWLSISRESTPRFEEFARLLEQAIACGRRWGHAPWTRAAARSRSAVLDEMLKRPDAAREVIHEIAAAVGWSGNLRDQLAAIAFNNKEYEEALRIWRDVLPQWKADELVHDPQPVFSARYAGIAAANLDDWLGAAEFFGKAAMRAAPISNRPWTIGLICDQAYALWRAGRLADAATLFAKVVASLEELPNTPDSFAEYAVHKLVGHTLAWITLSDGSLATPLPGLCSSLEPNELIKTLTPTPIVFMWNLIHQVAKQIDDVNLLERCISKFTDAPHAFLREIAFREQLYRAVDEQDFGRALKLSTQVARERAMVLRRRDAPIFEPDPPHEPIELTHEAVAFCVRPVLLAAIWRMRLRSGECADLLQELYSAADGLDKAVLDELRTLEMLSSLEIVELETVLKNSAAPHEKRLYAAALLLGRSQTSPSEVVYSDVIILDVIAGDSLLRQITEAPFCLVVQRDWIRFCSSPFLLRRPMLHVAPILDACGSKKPSLSTAAAIVLAAIPATNLNVPRAFLSKFHDITNAALQR